MERSAHIIVSALRLSALDPRVFDSHSISRITAQELRAMRETARKQFLAATLLVTLIANGTGLLVIVTDLFDGRANASTAAALSIGTCAICLVWMLGLAARFVQWRGRINSELDRRRADRTINTP